MVLRDRNHPSIILWSIGNEIQERADSSGLAIIKNSDRWLTSLILQDLLLRQFVNSGIIPEENGMLRLLHLHY